MPRKEKGKRRAARGGYANDGRFVEITLPECAIEEEVSRGCLAAVRRLHLAGLPAAHWQ